MSTLYFFFSFHVLRPVAVMCHNDDDESAVHLNEWMAEGRKGCVKGKPESSKSQKSGSVRLSRPLSRDCLLLSPLC